MPHGPSWDTPPRKCRSCPSAAEHHDSVSSEHGPACADCAVLCGEPECHSIATVLVLTCDDQGDSERVLDLCADHTEVERDRVDRIQRRLAWEAAYEAVRNENEQEMRMEVAL